MQSVKPKMILSGLGSALLLLQPFFTFPIFISILVGAPPLWLSWLIALIPLPLRYYLTGRPTCRTPFDIPIVISTAGIVLGFFISPDKQLGLTLLNTYLACVLFYYGLVNNSAARQGYWAFISVLLCLILLFLSVWNFAGGSDKQTVFNSWAYKLASTLPWTIGMELHPNVLGGAFAVVIPGLVALAIFLQRTPVRWGAGILALLFGLVLVLSASGSGWIATVAGILVVLLLRNARLFWGAALGVGAVAGAVWSIWHESHWMAVVFPFNNLLSRFEIWQMMIAVLKDRPLTGLGLGGWWSEAAASTVYRSPHNAYLQFYSDTGALGILALIAAIVISVRLFWQVLRSDKGSPYYGIAAGITGGIVAGGVHALVDMNLNILVSAGSKSLYFAVPLLWLWAALLVISCRHLLEGAGKVLPP